MTTREAIQILMPLLTDEILICTTGYVSRDACAVKDRPGNFYMIGSMGLAPAIGLGIASVSPGKKVVIFDGDGALLMGLGILPMVGSSKPGHFFHVVFDNESYASTGRQQTYSKRVPLEKLAADCGYHSVARVDSIAELEETAADLLKKQSARFLLIKCTGDKEALEGETSASPRVPWAPEEMTNRLKNALLL